SDNRITPGQFVEVTVPVASVENALVVPATAVQSGPRGEFVYVVKDDQSVELRIVKSELTLPDRVALASGVSEGGRVVVDGQFRLTPGAKIRPVTEGEGKGK